MEFYIKWEYPLRDNERKIFTQILKLKRNNKVADSPLKYVGMYIANLYNACNVDRDIRGYRDSRAFLEWKSIVGDKGYFQANNAEKYEKYILFDSITYLAYCVYKNTRSMIEEVVGRDLQEPQEPWSESTKKILGEYQYETFISPDIVQSCINRYVENCNKLIISLKGNFDREFYDELNNCLKIYHDNDLIKPYLSSINEPGRCFATFIEEATQKKYISLSGYLDAQDGKILKWLDRSAIKAFLDIIVDIKNSTGAEYVPINLNTRRYICSKYRPIEVVQSTSLNDIIDMGINNQKGYYSCCERKIFGHFNDNTPNGKLYVKLRICGECILGLCYQMKNGTVITLYDGLEC